MFRKFLIIGVLPSLFAISCKDDEVEDCVATTLPEFNINTMSVVEDSLFAEDTFLMPEYGVTSVIFKVSGDNRDYDSLNWSIGSDPRIFRESEFKLTFDEFDIGEVIVSLKIWRSYNECHPYDTIVGVRKSINLISRRDIGYAFEGTFEGYSENEPTNIFDVTVVNFGSYPPPTDDSQYWLHVHNLPKGCGGDGEISADNRIPSIEMASYRHFYIKSDAITTNSCNEIEGYGFVDSLGSNLIIDYRYRVEGTNDWEEDRFVGVRK